jgi:hypothetical protein
MPTQTLPANPSLDHLKYQAKDLLRAHRARRPDANQRIREFHPRFRDLSDDAIAAAKFALSDAQLAIAREYGFASWARLKAQVGQPSTDLSLPYHERIHDPEFRRAVDLLDDGDAEGLRAHLAAHPSLARRRVLFEGGNYFRSPGLLEFVAENPIRHGRLPANVVEVARVVLAARPVGVDDALALVASGRVAREEGAQIPLIDLLCDHGANPNAAMAAALCHGEFAAVEALRRRGARLDLPAAAATGRTEDARRLLPDAAPEARHLALAWSAQFGHAEIVRLLLDAGEDPSRYNPVGAHAHSMPLHQAAFSGHLPVVRLLVERGADREARDILFHGTPLGWAEHAGRAEVAAYLGSLAG